MLRGTMLHGSMLRGSCLSLVLALVLARRGAAQETPSWNLYPSTTPSVQVAFANGAMSGSNGAQVYLKVGSVQGLFTLDTGSCGILVSASRTPGDEGYDGVGGTLLGPGTETLTSSGIIFLGNLYRTAVELLDGAGATVATADVVVLQVTGMACSPGARSCTASNSSSGVKYMGIGFNRGVSTVTAAAGNAATGLPTNLFTNLVSPVGLAPGYILSDGGVTVGLSAAATAGFSFVKLAPEASPSPDTQAGTVWQQAPAGITVGGATGQGTILPDSGIDYAFLSPEKFVGVGPCPVSPPGGDTCLLPGVAVQVALPTAAAPLVSYSPTLNGSAMAPTALSLNCPVESSAACSSSATFLNSGRLFYKGLDYLFDPANGLVGYRATPGSPATVQAGLALAGTVQLPDGFQCSLPVVLYADTTIVQLGSGLFSGPLSPGAFALTLAQGTLVITSTSTLSGGATALPGATLTGAPGLRDLLRIHLKS
jgi:hypothetical protein